MNHSASYYAGRRVLICLALCAGILLLTLLFSTPAATSSSVDLTPAEQEWLRTHPLIRLAPDPEFRPIEYFDREGAYQGVAADNIRLLEQKLGIRFAVVRLENWNEILAQFRAGHVDALGAIVPTPQRRTFMRISTPLFNVPGAILVRKDVDVALDFAKLEGMRVAVVSNYTAHNIMKEHYPEIRLDVVPDTVTGLTKVSFGMVDAFVENLATSTYYMQESAISNLHAAGTTPFTYQWGIGVRKDWPELEAILNKGIAAITEDERRAVLNRWLPVAKPWRPSSEAAIALAVAAACLVLGAALMWGRTLRRLVTVRTEALNREIAERRRAEEEIRSLNTALEQRVRERTAELAASEYRYRSIVEHINDALYIHDFQGHIIDCNENAARMLGYPHDELTGSHLSRIDSPETAHALAEHMAVLVENGMVEFEGEHVAKDGRTVSVAVSARIVSRDGNGIVQSMVRDITESRQLKSQLLQSQKMEAVGILAGGVAHDFNNILQAITTSIHLARLKPTQQELLKEIFDDIQSLAERAADLTRGLLAFSRKQVLTLQITDLNELVSSVMKLYGRLVGEDIELRFELAPEKLMVRVDASLLQQVLLNLTTNARDAMPMGGKLTVSTMKQKRSVSGGLGNNGMKICAVLTFRDTGCGIEQKDLPHIFEPFYTTKEVGKGTGLGLSVVYGIIQQHGGTVEVLSAISTGTAVEIALPVVDESPEPQRIDLAVEERGLGETVLLVEDDPAVRKATAGILESYGYRVLSASCGTEAFRLQRIHSREISIALIDIVMPGMNGVEVYEELRSVQPDLKVIFLSGYSQDVLDFKRLGAIRYIPKPIQPADLVHAIQSCLRGDPFSE